jgi:hypothetical protein
LPVSGAIARVAGRGDTAASYWVRVFKTDVFPYVTSDALSARVDVDYVARSRAIQFHDSGSENGGSHIKGSLSIFEGEDL